jgi:hypothetical protein
LTDSRPARTVQAMVLAPEAVRISAFIGFYGCAFTR